MLRMCLCGVPLYPKNIVNIYQSLIMLFNCIIISNTKIIIIVIISYSIMGVINQKTTWQVSYHV